MGLIVIDENKCKKDGFCSDDCPVAIIQIEKKKTFPQMVDGGEKVCLDCGHCVAVCPHGALTHRHVAIDTSPSIDKKRRIDSEQAVQFLRSRRSIRFFHDRPVEKETIQRLIEIARYAPSASNAQPVEWIVFTDRKKIQHLAQLTVEWMRGIITKAPGDRIPAYLPLVVASWDMGFDAVLRNAPALIVATAHKTVETGMMDLSLALSYLDLIAPTMELGTCWAGLLQNGIKASPAIKDAIGLSKDHIHHFPMMLGYAKPKYHRLPERRPPKIIWK